MAATFGFKIKRGDDVSFNVTHTPVLNITGRTYRAQLRRSSESGDVAATFVCTVTDAANGVVNVALSRTVTAGLSLGEYVWDLEEAAPAVTTLLEGPVEVEGDVTR